MPPHEYSGQVAFTSSWCNGVTRIGTVAGSQRRSRVGTRTALLASDVLPSDPRKSHERDSRLSPDVIESFRDQPEPSNSKIFNKSKEQTASTALLVLTVGDLRADDNPALVECTKYKYCVPLCIINPAEPDIDSALSCVAYLRRCLRGLGNNLWVEISADSERTIFQYASQLPNPHILTNQKLDGSTKRLDLRLGFPSPSKPPTMPPTPPLLVPRRLPSPPPSFRFRPQPEAAGGWSRSIVNEGTCLMRLRKMVASSPLRNQPSFIEKVRRIFWKELSLGCISRARLEHEVRVGRQVRRSRPRVERRELTSQLQGDNFSAPVVATISLASVAAYDLKGSKRRSLEWDEDSGKLYFNEFSSREDELGLWIKHMGEQIRSLFLPEDVTPDYYAFTLIRFFQRCISATVTVLGTQSLIIALGLKSGANNQAAAYAWVLKNGFGRVGKMLWAGTKGKDFDVDPKRWRFNSALTYSLGNAMEIMTQIFPTSFLFFATMALTFKQVSWLTATATRNAMYRSFGRKRDNIGDITAKGEAQIVIAELIGMGLGIGVSKLIGTKMRNVLIAFTTLSLLDIAAIYQELRVVVFRNLNPQRTGLIVDEFTQKGTLPTPQTISGREHIIIRPLIGADGTTFTGLLDVVSTKEEFRKYMEIFKKEKFLIGCKRKGSKPCSGKQCKIVLHEDVRSKDILRAMLALGYLRLEKEVTFESIAQAHQKSIQEIRGFTEAAKNAGWNTDLLLYSTLKRRCSW